MPRDASGNYSLPAGNPVVSGTTITSTWANTTMPDIADALTNSLSRNGNGGMLVPLTFLDGSVGAPAISFTSEPTLGLYRGGTADMRVAAQGSDCVRFTPTEQIEVFRGGVWKTLLDSDQIAELTNPIGSIVMGWNPTGVLAGTWTQLPEGSFLMSTVGGADPSGGSNDAVTIDHTHTIDPIADHTHDRGTMEITGQVSGNTSGGQRGMFESFGGACTARSGPQGFVDNGGGSTGFYNGFDFTASNSWTGDTGASGAATPTAQTAGVDGTDLNKPQYVGVEVWQRTA